MIKGDSEIQTIAYTRIKLGYTELHKGVKKPMEATLLFAVCFFGFRASGWTYDDEWRNPLI